MSIRACLVDDEKLAVKELQLLLSDYSEIEICGLAETADEAIDLLKQQKPDLVFMDIQLKEVNVFSVIEELPPEPHIIFVTAYDQFATRAFEINALDYLLKPINPKRLQESINRFKSNKYRQQASQERYKYSDRIILTERNEYRMIKIEDIVSICSDGDYTLISCIDGKKHLLLRSMNKWEQLLPAAYFERIHRGTIVNLEYVDKIEKGFNNTCFVFMAGQTDSYRMSQRATAKFLSKYKV